MATTSYLPSGRVIPSGAIDGSNTIFTLPEAPNPVNGLQVYLNGSLLPVGTTYDRSGLTPYTLSGNAITLKDPPQPGDELVAYFTYATSVQTTVTSGVSASLIDLTTVDIVKDWLNTATNQQKTPPATPKEDNNIQRCITASSRAFLRWTGRGQANWETVQHSPFNEAIEYTETYDGNGNQKLFLRNWPILSVSSLTINGRTIPQGGSTGFQISSDGNSLVFPSGGYDSRYTVRGFTGYQNTCFSRGKQNIVVTYTAGFQAEAVTGEIQVVPTGAPYVVQIDQLPWLKDVGIAYFSNGNPLTAVTTNPLQGQYYVEGSGRYLFNSADAGQQLLFSYQSAGTPEDIRLAITQLVAVNYKRRQWIDQGSQSMANGAGTVSYRSWIRPPEVEEIIDLYSRKSV